MFDFIRRSRLTLANGKLDAPALQALPLYFVQLETYVVGVQALPLYFVELETYVAPLVG